MFGDEEDLLNSSLFKNNQNLIELSQNIKDLQPAEWDKLYGPSAKITDESFESTIQQLNKMMGDPKDTSEIKTINGNNQIGIKTDNVTKLATVDNKDVPIESLVTPNGQDYVSGVLKNANEEKFNVAGFGFVNSNSHKNFLPVMSLNISNAENKEFERLVLTETYNDNDRDKLLYNPATGPNPHKNVVDLYTQFSLEGRLNEDADLLDIYEQYAKDYDMVISSYNHNGEPLYSNDIGVIPYSPDEYMKKTFNKGKIWDPSGSMQKYAKESYNNNKMLTGTSVYEPSLGRYLLNWDVQGRPQLITKSDFTSLVPEVQDDYLDSQGSWLKEQGILGDNGSGTIVDDDMFLLELDSRAYMTSNEAMEVFYSDFRTSRDDSTKTFSGPSMVYMVGANENERGFFMNTDDFYNKHLAYADSLGQSSSLPITFSLNDSTLAYDYGFYKNVETSRGFDDIVKEGDNIFSKQDSIDVMNSSGNTVYDNAPFEELDINSALNKLGMDFGLYKGESEELGPDTNNSLIEISKELGGYSEEIPMGDIDPNMKVEGTIGSNDGTNPYEWIYPDGEIKLFPQGTPPEPQNLDLDFDWDQFKDEEFDDERILT